ncbi:acetyl-CoA acetyltransferase [Drepanopeziza brunnea f. sp. 'multigermtubi' MB_m1]|uniref:Acetyl-CoA acetyltransferase n=1 Tax=Marssonina brunnea f. sp. multigermtubi (strain MB_m1) TaxID=1072389 RepID=K1WXY5_MARBU|nr:acetyl-CoA acetyltransferase [Drepanopeziza brunnea f. sp. 'multigermtubi' MB_m1]EKD17437.1 acetyl-CoA acetyltransferase [Drepanopeziza brunnea f. sp. 'multigermtubi' MB_m1]
MLPQRAVPIVVGVGDIKNRSQKVEDAIEPMKLMLQATRAAIQDTGLSPRKSSELQSGIDSVGVVNTWTWSYADLPGLISEHLGVRPRYTTLSHHGGDSPAMLLDEAARRISFRECRVAVITGGEALASRQSPPGWTPPEKSGKSLSAGDISRMPESIGTLHSIGLPIHVYPLYENGLRAHRGQSLQGNNKESAELYADFAKVAEKNPLSWNYGQPAATEASIGIVSKKNRMICFPYPLLMNAFNNINLAGSCILTSTEYAYELGISESKWIYPLGGAGSSDAENFWERPNFYSSPAISRSLDEGLRVSGVTKDEIDLFDFYSCFPIVPKLACRHLGFPLTKQSKPITLLGGLTSFGGAGNNYSMHAITEMVRVLREGESKRGLVLANGGLVTYQYVVCLSSQPRTSPYPNRNPLPEVLEHGYVPALDDRAEGEAVIETYTVEFERDGSPLRGHAVGRLKSNGHRFLANHGDDSTLQQLSSGSTEPIGRCGWVHVGEEGRNLFTFDPVGKL